MQTFSINRAALLLERDRRTLSKALLAIKPDGKERGQARWKMSTIVAALAALERPAAGSTNTGSNPPEYAAYDRAYDQMKALPTLAKRRAATLALMPVLEAMIAALRARGREVDEHPDMTALRGDKVYQLCLAGFQSPCSWSHDQVWSNVLVDEDF